MRSVRLFIAIALAALQPATADEPTECQKLLVAINTPYPGYPTPEQAKRYLPGTSYLHVFVTGVVTVEFLVTRSGSVSDAKIIESSSRPIGRGRFPEGHFDGFLEANVLSTIMSWEFETIAQPCTARWTFTYEQEDAA